MACLLLSACGPAQAATGLDWKQVSGSTPTAGLNLFGAMERNDKMWLLGARPQAGGSHRVELWKSLDGLAWSAVKGVFPHPNMLSAGIVEHNKKIWWFGGEAFIPTGAGLQKKKYHDVWYSTDGLKWTRVTDAAPWSARSGHTTLDFDDQFWVFGGDAGTSQPLLLNDVWGTRDGKAWQRYQKRAPWPRRTGHASVFYKCRMYVIGGYDERGALHDVWSTPDGWNWTYKTLEAPFRQRGQYSAVVYDDKIWVLCTWTEGTGETYRCRTRCWYSADGKQWTEASPVMTPWSRMPERPLHLTFNSKLWAIGGGAWYTSGELFRDAALVGHTIPANLARGQTQEVTLTLRNTGSCDWCWAAEDGLAILEDTKGLCQKPTQGLILPPGAGVLRNQTRTFRLSLCANAAAPGPAQLKLRMSQGAVRQYGETITISLDVTPARNSVPGGWQIYR